MRGIQIIWCWNYLSSVIQAVIPAVYFPRKSWRHTLDPLCKKKEMKISSFFPFLLLSSLLTSHPVLSQLCPSCGGALRRYRGASVPDAFIYVLRKCMWRVCLRLVTGTESIHAQLWEDSKRFGAALSFRWNGRRRKPLEIVNGKAGAWIIRADLDLKVKASLIEPRPGVTATPVVTQGSWRFFEPGSRCIAGSTWKGPAWGREFEQSCNDLSPSPKQFIDRRRGLTSQIGVDSWCDHSDQCFVLIDLSRQEIFHFRAH